MARRSVVLVSVALLLAGVAAGSGGAARRATLPQFVGCAGTTQSVKPKEIIFACADANFFVDKLKWKYWTALSASANGRAMVNDCTPYCAAGHFQAYTMAVRLFRPKTCKVGGLLFTRLTYLFVGKKPKIGKWTVTLKAPFVFGHGCP